MVVEEKKEDRCAKEKDKASRSKGPSSVFLVLRLGS